MHNTRTGSIILEHDGGGNRSETVAALKIVIPRLLARSAAAASSSNCSRVYLPLISVASTSRKSRGSARPNNAQTLSFQSVP
ncbi:MAG: hypothetical protein ACRDOL_40570 [Streptosporangiaceae bacterium]